MVVSIFEVAGPVMVGPSSSHTAGAARLGRLATLLLRQPFTHVSFGLHGSFARTYRGHGTDLALVGGVLGLHQDDEEMRQSFRLAEERGITYDFYPADLGDSHENSVSIRFTLEDGSATEVIGSSIGGGRVLITCIDGIRTELTLDLPTLLVIYEDRPSMLSRISSELAYCNINIAVMKCSRKAKGGLACAVIETDSPIPDFIQHNLTRLFGVQTALVINPAEG